MAVKYKVVKQGVNRLSNTDRNYYFAHACGRSKIGLEKLAERISRRCTLSRGDIYATLVELTDIIPEFLLENQSVQLGDMGTFSLSLSSSSEAKAEDVSWRSIKEVKVQFRAGKEMKEQLKDVTFKKVND
ncbi:HU family DNA-binding protein [Carboxylicivirga mesophila]|uniref:HU family DNA-binding protein n=1 Tax=Carboxylicivirga mesophila TaxID=1166478 RepID=A0ABS5K678_9BACT|nr:HU family DNA-binding protein [Carboxylicivirga mesophila]MBS2210456.1 HU family DNA-binding protein [Carboxylicivirga mesophila]